MLIEFSEKKKLKIDDIISNAMASSHIPGLSFVIVHDGKILYNRGYGATNYSSNQPITPGTLIGIGSCTKSFTCLAIMRLQEEGKLSIEDPVSKFVPLKIGKKDSLILIKHLMSHTSGLPNLGSLSFTISRMSMTENPSWIPMASCDDFYAHINNAGHELLEKPGEARYYNNSGYVMLGHIIQEVSGMSYENYIEEHILKPLEITRGTFERDKIMADDDVITAYLVPREGKRIPRESDFSIEPLGNAAGGLFLSSKEMANYILMNLNQGKFKDLQIISSESLNKMQSIQSKDKPVTKHFGDSGYGFGWGILEGVMGYTMISHGGSMRVSGASISLFPELSLGFGIGVNMIAPPQVSFDILAVLIDKNISEELIFTTIGREQQKLVGIYKTYKGFNTIEIFIKSNLLHVKDINSVHPIISGEIPLIPISDDPENREYFIYVAPGLKQKIAFKETVDNNLYVNIERYRYHKE